MNTIIRKRAFSFSLIAKNSKSEWKRAKDRRLVDWRRVKVAGGRGGDGRTSFKAPTSSKVHVGGPDGGDGGRGGSVIFEVDSSLRSLHSLQTHYRAGDGKSGQGSYHTGASGKNITVKVPLGTLIRDHTSPTKDILFDLMTPGPSHAVVIAHGGEGGLGNAMFSSTANRKPLESSEGLPGEEKVIEVELRTIADVGLVGFPNAGKSTLLRALSRATPEVGDYPFTTLNPQVGVMEGGEEMERITVADIPGLAPGAHKNKGLGHTFLRHIQRCSVLLFVLDASISSPPEATMAAQLKDLRTELELYDKELLRSGCLIVVNKMDVCAVRGDEMERGSSWSVSEKFEGDVQRLAESVGVPVVPISALHLWNIQPLKEALIRTAKQFKTRR